MLHGTWKVSSKVALDDGLLDTAYEPSMAKTIGMVTQAIGATLGIDGATNVLIKSICSVIVHTPIPFLVKYLPADLHKETAVHVKVKVSDKLLCLDNNCGFRIRSFIVDYSNVMIKVRNLLAKKKKVDWAFGCVPHALNNF